MPNYESSPSLVALLDQHGHNPTALWNAARVHYDPMLEDSVEHPELGLYEIYTFCTDGQDEILYVFLRNGGVLGAGLYDDVVPSYHAIIATIPKEEKPKVSTASKENAK